MTAEPGLTPRFPVMTLGPVLVTVWPPSTAKLCSVPSGGAADGRSCVDLARGLIHTAPITCRHENCKSTQQQRREPSL